MTRGGTAEVCYLLHRRQEDRVIFVGVVQCPQLAGRVNAKSANNNTAMLNSKVSVRETRKALQGVLRWRT